jgi:hypothetical protein
MRRTILGLIAAIAVMSAAPAMACGGGLFDTGCSPCGQSYVGGCAPPVYAAPVVSYGGCNTCGGWATERLPDPEQQYYYVNQGPTYTGPGNWAPRRTYQEGYVSGSSAYRYGAYRYDGGYRARPYYRPWRAHTGFRYGVRPSVRYGYAPRAYGGHHVMRYGAPHRYGHHERVLRRYY